MAKQLKISKKCIQEMFDDIAPDYDSLNHIMSLDIDRIWRKRALKQIIRKDEKQQILDLACGTGDFTIEIAKAVAPGGKVTGMDISSGMLEVMKGKVADEALEERIAILQGDSEETGFADGSFDRVTIAFGIRNFEHREKALTEILRILKKDGKLVILELSEPENALMQWGYDLYFEHILPVIGGMKSGNKAAYKYLPASVKLFPKRKEWMETMSRCGYADVSHKAFSFGICRMYTGRKA